MGLLSAFAKLRIRNRFGGLCDTAPYMGERLLHFPIQSVASLDVNVKREIISLYCLLSTPRRRTPLDANLKLMPPDTPKTDYVTASVWTGFVAIGATGTGGGAVPVTTAQNTVEPRRRAGWIVG